MNPEISKLMKEMREKAEKATPGPWHDLSTASIVRVGLLGGGYNFIARLYMWAHRGSLVARNNAAYIAAANPANILKLLDYFEREEGQGWISVEQELPPHGVEVEVYEHDGTLTIATLNKEERDEADMQPEGLFWINTCADADLNFHCVTHWRVHVPPSPKSYLSETPEPLDGLGDALQAGGVFVHDECASSLERVELPNDLVRELTSYAASDGKSTFGLTRDEARWLAAVCCRLLAEMKVSAGLREEMGRIHDALGAMNSETALEKARQLLKRKHELYEGMRQEEDRAMEAESELQSLRERQEKAIELLSDMVPYVINLPCDDPTQDLVRRYDAFRNSPEHSTDEGKERS